MSDSVSGRNVARGGDGDGSAAAAPPRLYFCYQCDRTVSITPSPSPSSSSKIQCPNCGGGFLEEYENPNPNPTPILNLIPFLAFSDDDPSGFPSFSQGFGGFPLVFSSSTRGVNLGGGGGGGGHQNPFDLSSALFGGPLIGQSGSFRYELPTDDPEYENRSRDGTADGRTAGSERQASSGGTSQENPMTPRRMERRFRINIPWLFGGSDSPAEASNSGAGNNNSGDSNPGRGQAREEDLD